GQGQRVEDALAHEAVREPVRVLARGDEKAPARCFVERVAELVPAKLAEGLEKRDVEVPADDSRRDEHALRRLAQALDAAADQARRALGQLGVLPWGARVPPPGVGRHGGGT